MISKNFDADFDRLVTSFGAIAKLKGPLRQQFALNRMAAFHGLPRGEFRRLFQIWLAENPPNKGGRP